MKATEKSQEVIQVLAPDKAPFWKLLVWPLGGSGRMLWFLLMMFLSFYATGVAGMGVVLVGTLITGTRTFDGITDPIMGLLIDKTNGRFGKIRVFVIGSWIVMAISAYLLFYTTHNVQEGTLRIIYFAIVYILYMMGYSTLGMALETANPIITKDPKQRPVIFGLSMIYTTLAGTAFGMYMPIAAARHMGFGLGLFHELLFAATGLSIVMIGLAMIAIWKLDRVENFSTTGSKEKFTFKDMLATLKGNRPLQMFLVTNITDRLAQNVANNSVVGVMIFGIIIGDFAVSGVMTGLMLIPNMIVLLLGIKIVGKFGAKKSYIYAIFSAIFFAILLPMLLIFGDPTQIRFDRIGIMTVLFVILNAGFSVSRLFGNMCVGPMRPDIIDYETYRTGKFAPGAVVAVDSFIDKFVSQLYQVIVAVSVAAIGFTDTLPDLDTPLTTPIFVLAIFLMFGVLIISWIVSLVAMKFYPLDKEKMVEVQAELKRRREETTLEALRNDEDLASTSARN